MDCTFTFDKTDYLKETTSTRFNCRGMNNANKMLMGKSPLFGQAVTEFNRYGKIMKSQHWKLHKCEKLPEAGIQIQYSMDNIHRRIKIWRLTIRREATENDLFENHHLEEEGETIWETSLEITHCPYCGEYLYDDENIKFEDIGKFMHSDYSKWK